jgi:hypothetical protein
MQCPRLHELPPPPTGRTGWPWTEETPPLPASGTDGKPWPSISVVTPSFNQGQYLEETIRSVLLQGYPNLEYVLIDGGSSDDSLAIIKKYERWLTYWVSEHDQGQACAINKGLARCTGDIFNWINSDDFLAPDALRQIAMSFDSNIDAVAGSVMNFDDQGYSHLLVQEQLEPTRMVAIEGDAVYQQQGFWLRRERLAQCGGIDESMHYAFDWDMTLRYLYQWPHVAYMPAAVAHFRFHSDSKTCSQPHEWTPEVQRILGRLREKVSDPSLIAACDLRMRYADWWTTVATTQSDSTRSGWARVRSLLSAVWLDPKIRCTRFTLGAIRRIIFPYAVSVKDQNVSYEQSR